MAKKISIKLVKSTIRQKPAVRATVRSLGLKKLNSTVEHESNPAIMGMVKSVSHLLEIKELN
ncbi:MAG: 50S ribosomal protein L30 [Treponema sp.]|nr:MAG: 50S ribosomal protein L30 [Treponema sp.]